jgi:hypothetical protein
MNSQHQDVSFSFPVSTAPLVNDWITSCCQFYNGCLLDIDPKLAVDLLTDSLKGRIAESEQKQTNPTFEDALEPLCVHVIVQQILLLGNRC